MIWLTYVLAQIAFLSFGLATIEHHQRRFGTRPSRRRQQAARAAAWVLLGLSFPCAVSAKGTDFGPVAWAGLVMLCAGLAFLVLNFLPSPGKGNS